MLSERPGQSRQSGQIWVIHDLPPASSVKTSMLRLKVLTLKAGDGLPGVRNFLRGFSSGLPARHSDREHFVPRWNNLETTSLSLGATGAATPSHECIQRQT